MAKVLVTDDACFMRMMLKDILVRAGYEVYEACNGYDLLEKYPEVNPDIVTLDITMPEMDGLQAIKELMKSHPKAKVIMCSAMGQQIMVLEAIQSGAIDFLVKPFQAERVLEAINKALKQGLIMVYGSGDDESVITEYTNSNLEGGIKQKNLDLILDIIDDYVELREMVGCSY